jgi:hypothetical protein
MPDHHDSPFAAYLRRIDARLRDLPAERRAAIGRELLAHLEDAAAQHGADPADPIFQQDVIASLGPDRDLAAAYGAVHGGLYRSFRRAAFGAGLLGGVLGILAAPFAEGLAEDYGLLVLPLLLAFVAAGGLGIWGAIRCERQQPGGIWRVLVAAAVLLSGGVRVFYHGEHSFDPPGGLGLLLAGELLLCNAAVNLQVAALPRRGRGLLLAAALLLVSFVAPFSYLPNPLGLAYMLAGSYTYRPDVPLVNGFATLGADPVPLVRERLDRLIGQTGLDPLDPVQPLVGYTLRSVTVRPFGPPATVDVDLRYADGSVHRFAIPATQYGHHPEVVLTGLDRLLAEHRPLGAIPLATDDAPIRLGTPSRLPLAEPARHLGMTNLLEGWLSTSDTLLRWAPDGQRFLLRIGAADAPADVGLWLIALDGTPPRKLAPYGDHAAWSADGRFVVSVSATNGVVVLDLMHDTQRTLGVADDGNVAVNGAAAYVLSNGVLWRHPLDGGPATRLPLPGARSAPTLSPDGLRAAYLCDDGLCLADRDGTRRAHIPLGYISVEPISQPVEPITQPAATTPGPMPTALPAELTTLDPPHLDGFGLAWSPDGQALAVVTSSYPQGALGEYPAKLWLIARSGQIERVIAIAPNWLAFLPQWTADGRFVLVNTFPNGGRRIIAVEAASGMALDLSQPRWDAFASLAPDGRRLLLWNGRGGFWMAPLRERPK